VVKAVVTREEEGETEAVPVKIESRWRPAIYGHDLPYSFPLSVMSLLGRNTAVLAGKGPSVPPAMAVSHYEQPSSPIYLYYKDWITLKNFSHTIQVHVTSYTGPTVN
jgi:hypothetical protein